MSRIFRGYDAYGAHLQKDQAGQLALFLTPKWRELLASLFELQITGDIRVELHHHTKGSESGSVHNDLNYGWFLPSTDEINISDSGTCDYKTGMTKSSELTSIQRVRALACIFYLGNSEWRRGDGGETGLYRTRDTPVDSPYVSVPPINNSLVAFPVTPYSYHSFITNKKGLRNCVVLWLHRSSEHAVAEWGSKAIVPWR
jgi:hypothetical protein